MRTRLFFLFGLLLALWLDPASGQDAPPYRHPLFTGPIREHPQQPFDHEHLRLILRFEPAAGRVLGDARLRVRPLAGELQPLVLFGAELAVDSVFVGSSDTTFLATTLLPASGDSLVVSLDPLLDLDPAGLDPGRAFHVRITYSAQPKLGLYFIPEHAGAGPQIWSQGEPEDNRHWFPIFDYPGDKLTSEIIATVQQPLRVRSNGRLVDEVLHENGTATFHYVQDRPHAPYLISLVAGEYEVVPDRVSPRGGGPIPLSYWVYPDRTAAVNRTFGRTPEMMRFFSDLLDVPYPWHDYAQVVVRNFHFGGMENTGATTLTDRVLVDDRAARDYDPDPLIAHELVHQWFGNLVTPRFWTDIWLNEGFAAYLAAVFQEHHSGPDAFALQMDAMKEAYLAEAKRYRRPLVWNRWEEPIQMFDAHSYRKGAWVVHMLRHEFGDQTFFEGLGRYLKRHMFESVETEDLRAALEQATGRNLASFFDQWVYSAGHPELGVTGDFDASDGRYQLTVRQFQDGFLIPGVFEFPLVVDVYTLTGPTRVEVNVRSPEEHVVLPMAMPPRFIVVDPEQRLLIETDVEQTATAWVAQLRYAESPVNRLQAARKLQEFGDDPALLIGLRSALEAEQIPAVRSAIVRAIGSLQPSPAALRALVTAYDDEASGVREAALNALSLYEGEAQVAALALRAAERDASYRVQAAAVRTLARTGAPIAADVARSALITPSYRDVIRAAAIAALPHLPISERDAMAIALAHAAPEHAYEVRAAAAGYLGQIAATQPRAMERLVALLNDPVFHVRRAAVNAISGIDSENARRALQGRLLEEPQPIIRAALREAVVK
jgi:aminopeptidase N